MILPPDFVASPTVWLGLHGVAIAALLPSAIELPHTCIVEIKHTKAPSSLTP